ncbi:MAG: WD40/YVTN/BNR-like repeat-containing protein [Dehalococcoidia bacterium]
MPYTVFAGAGEWTGAPDSAPTHGLYGFDPGAKAWLRLDGGLPEDIEVRDFAVHPTRPGVIFAGSQLGPLRSTDAGMTWQMLPLPEMSTAEERVVWSINVHPTRPNTVLAGTQGSAVFRSDDGGDSWQRLDALVPPGAVSMGFPMRVVDVAFDVAIPDDIYVAYEVGGLICSRDNGASWQSCNRSLLALAEQDHLKSQLQSDTTTEGMMDSHALALSPAHAGTVLLANRMGLFESSDRGESWRELGIGRFSPLTYTRDVQVSPHDPERLYAAFSIASVSDAGSLYRSDDFGASWQRFDHGVEIRSTLMVIGQSYSTPDRVYCAARRGQVFGTEDGGRTWAQYRLPDAVEGIYAIACL